MNMKEAKTSPRANRTIVIFIEQETHEKCITDFMVFREAVDDNLARFPELFHPEISFDYRMKDKRWSKKLLIWIRRFEIGSTDYTIRPSFVSSYLTGITADIKKGCSFVNLTYPFGQWLYSTVNMPCIGIELRNHWEKTVWLELQYRYFCISPSKGHLRLESLPIISGQGLKTTQRTISFSVLIVL